MTLGRLAAGCVGISLIAIGSGASLAAPPATASAPPAATAAVGKPAATAATRRTLRKPSVRRYAAPENFVEPDSLKALGRMSAYMQTLTSLDVRMTTRRDSVDDFGQILTFGGDTDYRVKAPNAFAVDLNEPDKVRHYVYDGKTVTVYDPKSGFYARFAAPPTIRQTLDAAEQNYNVTFPLDDLFQWSRGDPGNRGLTAGHYVGDETINGQDTEHYAFRRPGIDWQIWIAKGEKPLPLRVVIVASDDPARPRFEANLDWVAAPQFAADEFVFTPPANAKSIAILSTSR